MASSGVVYYSCSTLLRRPHQLNATPCILIALINRINRLTFLSFHVSKRGGISRSLYDLSMCNSIKPAWEIVSEMVQKYKIPHDRPIDEARSIIEILRATLYALAVKLSFHYFLAFMQTAVTFAQFPKSHHSVTWFAKLITSMSQLPELTDFGWRSRSLDRLHVESFTAERTSWTWRRPFDWILGPWCSAELRIWFTDARTCTHSSYIGLCVNN